MGPLVVATKLHIPRPAPDRSAREALICRLKAGRDARLILVSAPPGAGKTTLLASWNADVEEPRPFAWLSLDEADNDPVRFWGGVLAALRSVVPELGAGLEAALRAPGVDVIELAVPALLNSLTDAGVSLVLALDDYHEIANADIHRSVEFVIEHLPRGVQIALASRRDPPFGLARLRARGELVEVRVDDLRLTAEEAESLLNGSLGLALDQPQIQCLRQRTEGWAAGLQLVGLSLQGRDDQQGFVSCFGGDDRQIVDYVGSEVLDRQPGQIRSFLMRTSILERLTGPLCDAVTEMTDSARTLVELERANLFVIPLDSTRTWYRFHHLFRDLLQHELRLEAPESVSRLHQLACEWHREQGLIPEAIRHAILAEQYPTAAELIAANWLTYVNRGELETLEAWTAALPPVIAGTDARLCLARAWMLLVLGRPGEVEDAVAAAERSGPTGPMRDGSRSVQSSAAMVRTSARLHLGDVGAARETAALAAELEPDPDAPWRPIVTNALGMTAYWSGQAAEAAAAFGQTVTASERVGNHTAAIYALGYLARIASDAGDHDEASRIAERALSRANCHALGEHWVTVKAHYATGVCARAAEDVGAARAAFERGLDLARRGGLRLDIVMGLLELTQVTSMEGDLSAARELQARASRQLAACADPGVLADRFEHLSTPGRARAIASRQDADDLSVRELAVLRLLPSQLSLREIGDELYVSFNTVKTHARNIYAKLRVGSREAAVARARELHLL